MKTNYPLALFTLFLLTLFTYNVGAQTIECLPNIGFESDTKIPWQCLEGSNLAGADGTTYTVTLTPGNCVNPNGDNAPFAAFGKSPNQHVIMSGTGTDPNSGLPVVCPTGGKYSLRLGDNFGGGAPNGEALAEAMSYTFKVSDQNAGLSYMYAAVLCEFTSTGREHRNNEAPRFEVVITDEGTKQEIDCGYYVVNANDYKLPGGGNLLPGKVENSQRWWYTKWTTVNLNLRKYIGSTLKIEFRVTDCSPVSLQGNPKSGDHGGYAYIDMKCEPAIIKSPIVCADSKTVQICAPDGYLAYEWIQLNKITGTMVAPLNGRCLTINDPKPGEIYKVNLKAYGGCNTDMIDTLKGFTLKAEKDLTLCPNVDSPFELNAIPNIENETKYVWTSVPVGFNSTEKNPKNVPVPNVDTKYTVIATDKFGCTATAFVNIKIACDIKVTLDPSEICEDACTKLEAKPTGGLGTITYKWEPSPNPGNDNSKGPFNVCPKETTVYTVTITDGQGKTASATATVTVNPKPIIKIRDTLICLGSSVTLTASGADKYTWKTPNAGDLTPLTGPVVVATPKETTTYIIIGETAKGCIDSAKVKVVVNLLPQLLVADKKICKGETTTLTVTGALTYKWTSPNTPFDLSSSTGSTVTATPTVTTTYTIVGEIAKGCIGDTTVTVTVNNQPKIMAGPDQTICLGESAQLQASGGMYYKWTGAGINNPTLANPLVVPIQTEEYIVVGTDANGCVGTDTVKVFVNPLVAITVSQDGTICKGDSLELFVKGQPGYTYLWEKADGLSSTTSTNPKASPAITTTYTVTASNGLCPPVKKTVTVNVNPIPKPKFTLDKYKGCVPLLVNFSNTSLDADGATFTWYFEYPSKDPANVVVTKGLPVSHKYETIGVFSVKLVVATPGGCKDSLLVQDTVETYPYPDADFVFTPEGADVWKPSITYFNKSTGEDKTKLKWYLDTDPTKLASTLEEFTKIYPDAGTYNMCLSVVTVHGCPDEICKPVTITPDWSFFIPNAFSPNGDGKNEKFNGVGVNILEYKMEIFDRWGLHICTINKVDTQDDRGNGWDGTVDGGSGEKQQEDCYVYKVQLTDIFHKKHYYVGRVTLIK